MSIPFGVTSLAVALVLSACGGDEAKPQSRAKGAATLDFNGCPYNDAAVFGGESPPTLNDYGVPVINGNGAEVTCSIGNQGASVEGHIDSSAMTLTVSSHDGATAEMLFYVPGAGGTPQAVRSVDANNDLASTCTLTTSRSDTLLTVGDGTIFAEYHCGKVLDSANVSVVCEAKGLLYFTGCSG